MDIRRHASCSPAVSSALAVVALSVAAVTGLAAGGNLPRLSNGPTKYAMALRQFRAGAADQAESAFRELASDDKESLAVRAFSLNMVGQIARLDGEGRKACETFARLASLLEPVVADESRSADPTLARLFGAACISMAEISEQTGDPGAAITACERVLRASGLVSNCPWLNEQSPRIMDKLAHLELSTRDLDGYFRFAERLRRDCPAYERAPLVELEMACIRLLQGSGDPNMVPQNSYDAPAWAIAYSRSREDASVRRRLLDIAASTCPEAPRTCVELVACYHAAWMFDALGETDEAVRRFSLAASAEVNPPDRSFITERTVETIRGYARLQHAILLAEADSYDEALQTLETVSKRSGEAHIVRLTESTRKNIETLKREMPNHEN